MFVQLKQVLGRKVLFKDKTPKIGQIVIVHWCDNCQAICINDGYDMDSDMAPVSWQSVKFKVGKVIKPYKQPTHATNRI